MVDALALEASGREVVLVRLQSWVPDMHWNKWGPKGDEIYIHWHDAAGYEDRATDPKTKKIVRGKCWKCGEPVDYRAIHLREVRK